MTQTGSQTAREKLEQAIAAQEALRGKVDDAVIDTAIASLEAQLAALEPAPQQRKLATILFMDIAGHTALTRDLDPEEQMGVVDPIIARLAARVTEFGGHVARYQGDGFKAVFGLPVAQENDPVQAIRSGLAIQAEANAISKELAEERGLSGFQVRVGITTGMVFAGGETEGEDTIKGAPVNLAARLERAAEPGTVLISHESYKHVRGVFNFEPLDPIQAKGFPEAVPVYRVLREKARPFYRGMRGVEGVETRMIGRELEFLQLQKTLREAIEDSERGMVTVVGEAGLGKSRLLYEFENWIDLLPEDVKLYRARGRLETRSLPYGFLRDLFAFRFQIQDDDRAEDVRRKLEDGFQETLGVDRRGEIKSHFAGQLLGYDFEDSLHLERVLDDPQQLRHRALQYIEDYFGSVSEQDPTLLLLEDLHWADDSSLDALNQIVPGLNSRSVLFLGTARPTLYERRPNWMEGQDFHLRMDLRPLSKRDSRRLVDEVLQRVQDVPAALGELVVSNAEGNPFYVEELVKMLVEDGVIVRDEPHWRVETSRLAEAHVPPTLTGVLQARLDSLPPEEREVLQQASVVGRVFWDRVLEHINASSGHPTSVSGVGGVLDNLRGRELVFRRETSAFADAREHIFKHALLREVTYESVLKRVRRAYHALVADWLIAHSGERAGEITGLIADHLELAGENAKALPYLRKAGEKAAGNYAHHEAAAYFSRGLALTPVDDLEARYELLLSREAVYDPQGVREAQANDLEELERIAGELGNAEKGSEVALRQANYAETIGDYQGVVEAAQRGISLAEAAGDQGRKARGYMAWGRGLWQQGDYQAARKPASEAMALAREADDPHVIAHCLRFMGIVLGYQGNNAEAEGYYEQALVMHRQVGDRRGEAAAINGLAFIAIDQGDYTRRKANLRKALAIYREIGDRWGESIVLNNLGDFSCSHGDYATAKNYHEEALAISRQIGQQWMESGALRSLGRVAHCQGDDALARAYHEQALAISRQTGGKGEEGRALMNLGIALIGLRELEEAETVFQEAISLREAMALPHLAMESRAGLARVALTQSDLNEAIRQVDEILAYLATGGSLDAMDEPFRIYLTCVEVLQASDDPRAGEFLGRTYRRLQERAAKIPDEAVRRSYLENVPWNREIVQLWEESRGDA